MSGNAAERMPETAALVAELRAVLGAEVVDAAIKAGQQARREYAKRLAEHGKGYADNWLARQRFPHGRFWALENGCEVGINLDDKTCN